MLHLMQWHPNKDLHWGHKPSTPNFMCLHEKKPILMMKAYHDVFNAIVDQEDLTAKTSGGSIDIYFVWLCLINAAHSLYLLESHKYKIWSSGNTGLDKKNRDKVHK